MHQLPHSYKITDKRTNKVYIGICIKKDKTYLDRFKDHMSGFGSLEIAKLIESGYTEDDFEVEFLEYYSDAHEASKREVELIKEYDSYGNGLNGNRGGGFGNYAYSSFWNEMCWLLDRSKEDYGLSRFVFEKVDHSTKNDFMLWSRAQLYKHFREVDSILKGNEIWEDRCIDLFFSRFSGQRLSYKRLKLILDSDKFNDKTKNRIVDILLSSDDYIVIMRSILRYVNEERNTCAYMHQQINKEISEKIFLDITNGHHDKTELSKIKMSMLGRYTQKQSNPTDSEGWKLGRLKFKERMKSKSFTENEINSHIASSERLKEEWKTKSKEEIEKRTSSGLTAMNEKNIICPYCKKPNLTKGNAKRWHFDNCKFKGINVL